jgi:transcriptional regulator NrdR family protein
MICPCGARTKVLETRPSPLGVRRRRQCEECGERFPTYEMTAERLEELRRRAALWDEVVRRSHDSQRDAG